MIVIPNIIIWAGVSKKLIDYEVAPYFHGYKNL